VPFDALAGAYPAQRLAELVQGERRREPGLSTIYDAITSAERAELAAAGVRAELGGVFIAAAGHAGFADHWRAVAPVAARARRWCERNRRALAAVAR
jgi:hypothetical protein